MRRGQAFETMMLVISVIVALAILNVLMGIINGVQLDVANSPDTLMHGQLKQIVSDGYGFTTPQKVTLKRGTRLDIRSIAKTDIPEVNPGNPSPADANAKFCVDTTEITNALLPGGSKCTTTAISQGSTSLGPAVVDVSFYFSVCGDSNIGSKGGYRIWIGGTTQSAGKCQTPLS